MTPALLLAILVLLALALVGLLIGLGSQLRSRRVRPSKPGPSKSKIEPKRAAKPKPQGDAEDKSSRTNDVSERLPRVVGRKRQILPSSSGGGDQTATQKLLRSGAYASCEERLELAFESYSHGRISLDTYEAMVRAEGEKAKRLQAELRAKDLAGSATHAELDRFREEIESISIAVQWCLDWAEDRRKGRTDDSASD